MKSSVLILYTGGTIGMAHSQAGNIDSPLIPQEWQQLIKYMPSLSPNGYFQKEKNISFQYLSLDPIIDSSQISPDDWKRIALTIQQYYDEYDGFIIIHGTDTMAYTASALSFMLQGLSKPVVLTGSQLPISHPRTDASTNLINSIYIAAAKSFDLPIVQEVCIAFNDKLLRGNRTEKYSVNDFGGFVSTDYPPLGELEEKIIIHNHRLLKTHQIPFQVLTNLNRNILNINLFPGFRAQFLHTLLENSPVEGILLRTFGFGNAPITPDFLKALEIAKQKEIIILNITQCFHGSIAMNKYDSGSQLLKYGVMSGADLTAEAALTKMMWVLGNFSKLEAHQKLVINIAGEMTI